MQLRHTKHLLWLFAAALLLMQSMAVWHEAEHAFHEHISICDQLNVVSHTPSIDANHQLGLGVWQQHFQPDAAINTSDLIGNIYHSFAIRAPPVSS